MADTLTDIGGKAMVSVKNQFFPIVSEQKIFVLANIRR